MKLFNFFKKDNNEKVKNKASYKGKQYINELIKERYQQDTKTRKYSSVWVVTIITLWLCFTGCVFVMYGDKFPPEVICTLLATTTGNVIGLGIILLKGLFTENKNK